MMMEYLTGSHTWTWVFSHRVQTLFKRPNSKEAVCVWSYLLVTGADTGVGGQLRPPPKLLKDQNYPNYGCQPAGRAAQLHNQGEPTKPGLASSSPASRLSNTSAIVILLLINDISVLLINDISVLVINDIFVIKNLFVIISEKVGISKSGCLW